MALAFLKAVVAGGELVPNLLRLVFQSALSASQAKEALDGGSSHLEKRWGTCTLKPCRMMAATVDMNPL